MSGVPSQPVNGSRRFPITATLTWLLTIFLVLLPKGGVKLGDIPLTWGYMILALTSPVLALLRFTIFPLRFGVRTLAALASIVPFQILFVYSYRVNGVFAAGLAISTVTCFFVLPYVFLVIYPPFLDRLDGIRFARLLCGCIFATAVFGIILFVVYPITGHLFEIPYITVNADDYGTLEATKNISRGAFLKLVSTYNNGNLYGVAMLILLPLYIQLEPRALRRNVVKLALLLTLSRTVWLGLILEQCLSLIPLAFGFIRTFPRVSFGPALRRLVFIVLTIVAVLGALALISGDISFLFDKELGGRSGTVVSAFHNVTWLPSTPVWGFYEIVYTSALGDYGILGCISIVLAFVFPLVLGLTNRPLFRSPLRLAALQGLIIYMVMCGIDGALNLIPVMAFYWFTYSVMLHGWPGGVDLPEESAQPSLLPLPA